MFMVAIIILLCLSLASCKSSPICIGPVLKRPKRSVIWADSLWLLMLMVNNIGHKILHTHLFVDENAKPTNTESGVICRHIIFCISVFFLLHFVHSVSLCLSLSVWLSFSLYIYIHVDITMCACWCIQSVWHWIASYTCNQFYTSVKDNAVYCNPDIGLPEW